MQNVFATAESELFPGFEIVLQNLLTQKSLYDELGLMIILQLKKKKNLVFYFDHFVNGLKQGSQQDNTKTNDT